MARGSVGQLGGTLGGSGKNLNDDIARLVKDGLLVDIQRALDVVRVTGNNAVHPGHIDTDDVDVCEALFSLVNVIVENRISSPKKIKSLYDSLPTKSKAQIAKRDKQP